MRRNKGYCSGGGSTIYANTVNITNVTNVTRVTSVSHGSWNPNKRHKHIKHRRRGERPPELFRFCASCGIIDHDKVSRMSSGQVCEEATKVLGYTTRNLGRSVGNLVSNAGGFVKNLVCLGGAAVGAVAKVCR